MITNMKMQNMNRERLRQRFANISSQKLQLLSIFRLVTTYIDNVGLYDLYVQKKIKHSFSRLINITRSLKIFES